MVDPLHNWVYDITKFYNASLTFSWSYAKAGATINQSIIANEYIPSVEQQVKDAFLPGQGARGDGAKWTASNAIAGFFIGINEYAAPSFVLGKCISRLEDS